jgi:hypothetical protein
MSNCNNDDDDVIREPEDLFSGDNPFVGTWESNVIDTGNQIKLVFSDIAFEAYIKNETISEYVNYPEIPNSGCFLYTFTDDTLIILPIYSSITEKYPYNFRESKILNFYFPEEYRFIKISKSYKLAYGDEYINILNNYENLYGELK